QDAETYDEAVYREVDEDEYMSQKSSKSDKEFGYKKEHLEPIFILGKNNKQKRDPNVIQRLEANRKKFNKK
ncbi:MAG: hypothetical protein E7K10_12890, partial [Staphylococcus sp.]|nr:hypothetical protein [Staphylococcus sp.]